MFEGYFYFLIKYILRVKNVVILILKILTIIIKIKETFNINTNMDIYTSIKTNKQTKKKKKKKKKKKNNKI